MGESGCSSSSSGWASKLRLFIRQGVEEGEVWGLLRPCKKITHNTPSSTARHRWVWSRSEIGDCLSRWKTKVLMMQMKLGCAGATSFRLKPSDFICAASMGLVPRILNRLYCNQSHVCIHLLVVFSEAMYFHSLLPGCFGAFAAWLEGDRLPEELQLICLWVLSRTGFFCKSTAQLQKPSLHHRSTSGHNTR